MESAAATVSIAVTVIWTRPGVVHAGAGTSPPALVTKDTIDFGKAAAEDFYVPVE